MPRVGNSRATHPPEQEAALRQYEIQACVLFERPYRQEELFEEPLPFEDGAASGDKDEPLIGYYTTRYVTAQSLAEATHYVEEALTTDEDMPSSRIIDLACTELEFETLSPEIRSDSGNPDIPGIWYEEGMGFFSHLESDQMHHQGHDA